MESANTGLSSSTQQAMGSSPAPDTHALFDEINDEAIDELVDALNITESSSSQALTYGMYLSRNKTISDIAADMTNQNLHGNNGASETFARQGEINEWQAQNKLDTFFFLQCLFIYLMIMIILIYLRQGFLIPDFSFYMLTAFLTLILVGILVNRAYYTRYLRDNKYWNRRFIGMDMQAPGPAACIATTASPAPAPVVDAAAAEAAAIAAYWAAGGPPPGQRPKQF